MDLMKTEYEFLDLSDVKGADLNSLQCALFERKSDISATEHTVGRIEATTDPSLNSSSTACVPTVSNSVDSIPGGEGEMAPHSPARGAAGPPPHPPPYAQPPPTYPPPHHQWPVAPPNVYVSQVTANVNVHGYMSQYYQPPTPQYAPSPQERVPRTHRRDRRTKRQPSPPPHPTQPYYLQYPQYYQAAQAQGAPLYHLPVYQPLMYGPYTYPPYYPEYPIPVEGDAEKGPEEYPAEVLMEQEAVDAYYANAHYVGPPYGPPVDGGVEYVPPMYLPPPHHPQPLQAAPHHHPVPHQFNVHAKNFVQGQGRNFIPNDKITERRSPPTTTSTSAATHNVDALPVKDLKISGKGLGSPKQNERLVDSTHSKPTLSPAEKSTSKIDPKPIPIPPEKTEPVVMAPTQQTPRTFPPLTTGPASVPTSSKIQPTVNKTMKGPTAPFSSAKQPMKSTTPQTIVPVQPAASTPKAPFGNRQKREITSNRSPSNDVTEILDRASSGSDHGKREPPLPPSKAPMPISITLHSAGQPLIVTSKPPFGHSRKASSAPEPPPVPQPPPPAPTASDFPPPPTPRNRTEPPPPMIQPQPQPAPGKSWASLFSTKPNTPAPASASVIPPPITTEEPVSPTTNTPPVAPNVQKPVAKVPPYDASPLSGSTPDKPSQTSAASVVSYSEKTSVNAFSGTNTATSSPKTITPSQTVTEVREIPVQRDTPIAAPPVLSSFCDDPNSYRMGEFLTKYQLDNRSVSILPRGLTNRSNYCYVNAILQALIACPPFYNLLKALPYQTRRGKSSTPVIDSMVELCYEFSPAGGVVRNPRGSSAAAGCAATAPAVPGGPPLDGATGLRVLRALRPFPGSQEGRQEDAEEFLGCLLNSLNDEMLELMKLVEPEEPKEGNGQPNGIIAPEQPHEEDDDDDEWKVMGPRNRGAVERRWAARRTPVADIFRGSTRVRLHRAHHHDVTDAVQPFFTLQLDIERASNVKDALELLAGKDTLEGVNDAWQQLSLEELPVALLLHLKCFQLDQEGHTAKIVKNIEFPIDLKIDPKIMSSKMKYSTKQRLYKLFAVVYHEGVEAVKGHYVTDTYHGQAGWIRYDDSTVTQVSDAQVLKPKPPRMPYLLMYRRLDTLPPAHHRAPPKPE